MSETNGRNYRSISCYAPNAKEKDSLMAGFYHCDSFDAVGPRKRFWMEAFRKAAKIVTSYGLPWLFLLVLISLSFKNTQMDVAHKPVVRLMFTDGQGPVTGRLMLCIADRDHNSTQPRFLITDLVDTQQMFGMDVHGVDKNTWITMDNEFGYPKRSLMDIPSGRYWVQGVLNKYVHYDKRQDGHKPWLPAFHTFESAGGVLTAPGTLYSTPMLVTITNGATIDIKMEHVTPEEPPLVETEYLKHIEFKSNKLSKFWGIDVYLKAWVLLPFGYYDHESTKYPLFIYNAHYSRNFSFQFLNDSQTLSDHPTLAEEYGHYLYKNWTGDSFKKSRGLIVQLQHANPYYDDSYYMNSANIGPYGDAITFEFIPYIEKLFRGIGQGWSRTLYGGSTGGWESFAVQVYFPNEYNGCWSFCPDSFDFHRFQLVDLVNSKNAYYNEGSWRKNRLGSRRDYLGNVVETMEQENHFEYARGTLGRSGGQWDAWQAVYGPVNATDGYPARIWDKVTGKINHDVVDYWRQHFDLNKKLHREWPDIGHALVNKLKIYVGVMDSYYLNGAVYLMEQFLENTSHPYYNGTITYGVADGKGYEHCWSGSFNESVSMAWNTLNQRIVPEMARHVANSAPSDAELRFDKY